MGNISNNGGGYMNLTEEVQLHLGDSLILMGSIPNESVDMVLCDLPYGTTRNSWDKPLDLDILWKQYERVIKPNGAIVLFAQTPYDKILGASNLKLLKYEWIWEKELGSGFLNAKKAPLKIHENILVFYKKQPTYNPQMRLGFKPYKVTNSSGSSNYDKINLVQTVSEGERYPTSVLRFPRDKNVVHPTQKPVALLEYLIATYTNKGDLVLDNCMGSGSTMVACIQTDRRFLGYELHEPYFNLAVKRGESALHSPKLSYD